MTTGSSIPYDLMPVAAALLSTSLVAVAAGILRQLAPPTKSGTAARKASSSSSFSPRVNYITALALLIAYSYIIGRIDGAMRKHEHSQFDPYAILQVTKPAANDEPQDDYAATITAAYRTLVKQVHPSNSETGNRELFEQVVWAYRALTEDAAMQQFQKHGHPAGPLLTPVFMLALPKWLFQWPGSVALYMKLVYVSVLIIVAAGLIVSTRRSRK